MYRFLEVVQGLFSAHGKGRKLQPIDTPWLMNYQIRSNALIRDLPLITTIAAARAAAEGITSLRAAAPHPSGLVLVDGVFECLWLAVSEDAEF